MRLRRLGVVPAAGYHKCASGAEREQVTEAVVRRSTDTGWEQVARVSVPGPLADGEVHWVDLDGLEATGLAVEIERALVDVEWPGWNLAMTGLVLDGDPPPRWRPSSDRYLQVDAVELGGLPPGVTAEHRSGQVRYRGSHLEVGFRLRTPGFAHLGIDADGIGRTERNLLQVPRSMDIVRSSVYPSGVYPVLRDQHADYLAQGPRLTSSAGVRAAGFLCLEAHGSVTVRGNQVIYDLEHRALGQHLRLRWTVLPDRLNLHVERRVDAPLRAWHSGVWHVATDNRVTPSTVLAAPLRQGETGHVRAPAAWHFPRHGTLRIEAGDGVLLRADSVRPLDTNTLELKLGETPRPEGDALVAAGLHVAEVELVVADPVLARVRADAPEPVRRMVARHAVTALAYRQDTATYSNNGASMHCTSLLNDLSSLSLRLGAPVPGADPRVLLRVSLERWLDGAPGYGGGRTSHGGHLLDDEYVHIAADTLVAVARYLLHADDGSWLARREGQVLAQLDAMRVRDLDGDGLVESALRRGVGGEHQWGTAWADTISFGWKDAWANAVVFEAVVTFDAALRRLGRPDLAEGLGDWAQRLRAAYLPTFLNPETGWIAGWRSADGELHDHAFPLVNGAACRTGLIEVGTARGIMAALWAEFGRAGYDDFRNGLPLNLRRIPEDDIGGVSFGLPRGGYMQGGASHHRARLFVDALARVGMAAQADLVLESLSETVADDSAFGGLGSGVDWRMWDGTPSGYEGHLAEGFSVLISALDRWSE